MKVKVDAELSKKNEFYLPKDRYLELVHHCRQYNYWVKDLDKGNYVVPDYSEHPKGFTIYPIRPVEMMTEDSAYAWRQIQDFDNALTRTVGLIGKDLSYLLRVGITRGVSYDVMMANRPDILGIDRHFYYQKYRQFFWELNKEMKSHRDS